MVGKTENSEIIKKKQEGKSNREVSRETGFDRDTVSKYWTEYQRQTVTLNAPGADIHAERYSQSWSTA
jgi:DNA-binding NarL/FixJ family response regulator